MLRQAHRELNIAVSFEQAMEISAMAVCIRNWAERRLARTASAEPASDDAAQVRKSSPRQLRAPAPSFKMLAANDRDE